ncbi:cyclic lactone autoinducer peptide [Paenibacillus sp. DS2015]
MNAVSNFAFSIATLLTVFARNVISTNSFLYFYKGEIPKELLK